MRTLISRVLGVVGFVGLLLGDTTTTDAMEPYGGAYEAPTYQKEGNLVTVTGLIKGKFGHVWTIPKNLAPKQRLVFNLNNHAKPARVDVYPDGRVVWIAGGKDHGWISLSGIRYSLKPTGKLSLARGLKPYGRNYAPPTYSKNGEVVSVSGLIEGNRNGHLATLPPGARPAKRLIFNVNNHAKSTRVDVFPNGRIVYVAGGKDHKWLSLAGIVFKAGKTQTAKLVNGWQHYGGQYAPANYARQGDTVVLGGLIRRGKYGHMLTVPKAFAPAKRLVFSINNHAGQARVDVLPNGQVVWVAGTKNHGWVSLAGISYKGLRPVPTVTSGTSSTTSGTTQVSLNQGSQRKRVGDLGKHFLKLPNEDQAVLDHVSRLTGDSESGKTIALKDLKLINKIPIIRELEIRNARVVEQTIQGSFAFKPANRDVDIMLFPAIDPGSKKVAWQVALRVGDFKFSQLIKGAGKVLDALAPDEFLFTLSLAELEFPEANLPAGALRFYAKTLGKGLSRAAVPEKTLALKPGANMHALQEFAENKLMANARQLTGMTENAVLLFGSLGSPLLNILFDVKSEQLMNIRNAGVSADMLIKAYFPPISPWYLPSTDRWKVKSSRMVMSVAGSVGVSGAVVSLCFNALVPTKLDGADMLFNSYVMFTGGIGDGGDSGCGAAGAGDSIVGTAQTVSANAQALVEKDRERRRKNREEIAKTADEDEKNAAKNGDGKAGEDADDDDGYGAAIDKLFSDAGAEDAKDDKKHASNMETEDDGDDNKDSKKSGKKSKAAKVAAYFKNNVGLTAEIFGQMVGEWEEPFDVKGMALYDTRMKVSIEYSGGVPDFTTGLYAKGKYKGKVMGFGLNCYWQYVTTTTEGVPIWACIPGVTADMESVSANDAVELMKLAACAMNPYATVTCAALLAANEANVRTGGRDYAALLRIPPEINDILYFKDFKVSFAVPGKGSDEDLGIEEGVAASGMLHHYDKLLGKGYGVLNTSGLLFRTYVPGFQFSGMTLSDAIVELSANLDDESPRLTVEGGVQGFKDGLDQRIKVRLDKYRMVGMVDSKLFNLYEARAAVLADIRQTGDEAIKEQGWSADSDGFLTTAKDEKLVLSMRPVRRSKDKDAKQNGDAAQDVVLEKRGNGASYHQQWIFDEGIIANAENDKVLTLVKGKLKAQPEDKKLEDEQTWELPEDGSIYHPATNKVLQIKSAKDGSAIEFKATKYQDSKIPVVGMAALFREDFKNQIKTVASRVANSTHEERKQLILKGVDVTKQAAVKLAGAAKDAAKKESDGRTLRKAYALMKSEIDRDLGRIDKAYKLAKAGVQKAQKVSGPIGRVVAQMGKDMAVRINADVRQALAPKITAITKGIGAQLSRIDVDGPAARVNVLGARIASAKSARKAIENAKNSAWRENDRAKKRRQQALKLRNSIDRRMKGLKKKYKVSSLRRPNAQHASRFGPRLNLTNRLMLRTGNPFDDVKKKIDGAVNKATKGSIHGLPSSPPAPGRGMFSKHPPPSPSVMGLSPVKIPNLAKAAAQAQYNRLKVQLANAKKDYAYFGKEMGRFGPLHGKFNSKFTTMGQTIKRLETEFRSAQSKAKSSAGQAAGLASSLNAARASLVITNVALTSKPEDLFKHGKTGVQLAYTFVGGKGKTPRIDWDFNKPKQSVQKFAKYFLGHKNLMNLEKKSKGKTNPATSKAGALWVVRKGGNLHYYHHDKNHKFTIPNKKIGTGWHPFTHVFSGGGGLIYAIEKNGNLLAYQQNEKQKFVFTRVLIRRGLVNVRDAFSADGIIYIVYKNGHLRLFRHDSNFGWNLSNHPMGDSWNVGIKRVFGTGGGNLYAVRTDGSLEAYKHTPGLGWVYTNQKIATGWGKDMTVVGGAGGVIYSVAANGHLLYSQLGAGNRFSVYRKKIGSGWGPPNITKLLASAPGFDALFTHPSMIRHASETKDGMVRGLSAKNFGGMPKPPIVLNDTLLFNAHGAYLSADRTGVVQMHGLKPQSRHGLTILDAKAGAPHRKPLTYGGSYTFRTFTARRFLQAWAGEDHGKIYRYVGNRRVWDDYGMGIKRNMEISRPVVPDKSWVFLGDLAYGHRARFPHLGVVFKDDKNIFRKPNDYWGMWDPKPGHYMKVAQYKCPGGWVPMGVFVYRAWDPSKDKSDVHQGRCIRNWYAEFLKGSWWDATYAVWREKSKGKYLTVLNKDASIKYPLAFGHRLWAMKSLPTSGHPRDWSDGEWFLNKRFFDDFSYYAEKNQVRSRVGKTTKGVKEWRFQVLNAANVKDRGRMGSGGKIKLRSLSTGKYIKTNGRAVMANVGFKDATVFTVTSTGQFKRQ